MLLPLQKGILYGPIESRRLGKSLGVNLMPCTYKLCSFNCVYCHYGVTDILKLDQSLHMKDMPSVAQVIDRIKHVLESKVLFDYITFSGNGEPTLHPHFSEIVFKIAELRDKIRPNVKLALLSNSSGLYRDDIGDSLKYIDMPVFKLDTGTSILFQQINRPARNLDFKQIINYLQDLTGIYIQTVFMDGTPSNTGADELEKYFELIELIKPIEVQIYSLDRPVPNKHIKRVLPAQLEEIASLGAEKTGIPIKAFFL